MDQTITLQERKLRDHEDNAHRNNLVVFGVPEDPNETREILEEMVVHKNFKDKLGLSINSVECIHRIGRSRSNKLRSIVVRTVQLQ